MPETLLLHIDGEDRLATDGTVFQVSNPATGEPLYHVAHAGSQDVDDAVAAARAAFDDGRWKKVRARDRARVLNNAAGLLADRIDDFARLETLQIGRPLREMRAQLKRLPEWFEYFAAVAQTVEGTVPDFGAGYLNIVKRVPLGVGALITPWNHPLLITMKKVSAALAAGNSLVIKPSELGPAVPLRLARLLEDAGVPDGVVNVITGLGATTGRFLSEHSGISKIDVTGGTETGRVVASNAGRSLIPITAELGGKAPVVVFEDADIEEAVAGVLFASFIASGQTCVQGARILVQKSIHDAFVSRFVERARELRVGDPLDVATQVGPLVSENQLSKVSAAVDAAVNYGAEILCGGGHEADARSGGWYYPPTVVSAVATDNPLWYQEVFGPVAVVRAFEDEDDALRQANDSPYGLGAAIWTNDVRRALRAATELDAGIVWINDHHRIDPASPWGGAKDSGIGSENGLDAYKSWTRTQSIIVNTSNEHFDWYASRDDVRYA